IMEAAYARPATVLAGSESAFVALLAAANHPDRFEGLVLWAPSPSWRRSEDLPWERSDDELQAALGVIRRVTNMGSWAERFVRDALPSLAGDADAVSQVQALSALAGSAEAWYQETRMFHAVDLRDLLASIRTQTLVLIRPECAWTTPESARYVADHLPNAALLELPGADGLPWIGQSDVVLDAIQEFMTGARHVAEPDRMLATVLFTDIVGSTEMAVALGDRAWRTLLEQHHSAIRASLRRYRGREIDTAGDGFFAIFDGPARAVECARAAVEATAALGVTIRAGCHTGEVELARGEV